MISLAGRDILHGWGKFVFTGLGLGLLIGVTLTMAGVYRGMVDDARALLDNSGADLWVVEGTRALRFVPLRLGAADLEGRVQVLDGLDGGERVVVYSQKPLKAGSRIEVVERIAGVAP